MTHDNVTDIVDRLVRIETRENSHGLANEYVVNPDGLEATQVIATLRKQLENARSEALEEAARLSYTTVVAGHGSHKIAGYVADAIRALKVQKGEPC